MGSDQPNTLQRAAQRVCLLCGLKCWRKRLMLLTPSCIALIILLVQKANAAPRLWHTAPARWPSSAMSTHDTIHDLPPLPIPSWEHWFPNETDVQALQAQCCERLYPKTYTNAGQRPGYPYPSFVDADTIKMDCALQLGRLLGLEIENLTPGKKTLPLQLAANVATYFCPDPHNNKYQISLSDMAEALTQRTTTRTSARPFERLPQTLQAAIIANDTFKQPIPLYIHLLVYDLRSSITSEDVPRILLDRVYRANQTHWRQAATRSNFPWSDSTKFELHVLQQVEQKGRELAFTNCNPSECELFTFLADVDDVSGSNVQRGGIPVDCIHTKVIKDTHRTLLQVPLPGYLFNHVFTYPLLENIQDGAGFGNYVFTMQTTSRARVLHVTQKLVPRPDPDNVAEITATGRGYKRNLHGSLWETYDRLAHASVDLHWQKQNHVLRDWQKTMLTRYGPHCFRVYLQTVERHRIV